MRKISAVERLVEALAAACLSGACAFAVVQLAPLSGVALAAAALVGALGGGAAAMLVMRATRPPPAAVPGFELLGFETDELLLDQPIEAGTGESRVVRLFGVEQPAEDRADESPRPLPRPGELVTRISDHLAERGAAPVEASAALHAALADLRRSLR